MMSGMTSRATAPTVLPRIVIILCHNRLRFSILSPFGKVCGVFLALNGLTAGRSPRRDELLRVGRQVVFDRDR